MTRELHSRSPTGLYHLHLQYDAVEAQWYLCIEEFEGLYELHVTDALWMQNSGGLPVKRFCGHDVPLADDAMKYKG